MPNYKPGDKITLGKSLAFAGYAGKSATLIEKYIGYSTGQSWVIQFDDGEQDIIHEGHFVGFARMSFAHGERVYHRGRRQYGAIVDHEKLDTDPTSACVQFDGSTDILEVSKAMLEPQKAQK